MNDRELLKLAAKAAGIEGQFTLGSGNALELAKPRGFQLYWNPLNNDGDAFRLMIKINLGISISGDYLIGDEEIISVPNTYVSAYMNEPFTLTARADIEVQENHDTDPYAATRRAIVKVAAMLGKQMEDKK